MIHSQRLRRRERWERGRPARQSDARGTRLGARLGLAQRPLARRAPFVSRLRRRSSIAAAVLIAQVSRRRSAADRGGAQSIEASVAPLEPRARVVHGVIAPGARASSSAWAIGPRPRDRCAPGSLTRRGRRRAARRAPRRGRASDASSVVSRSSRQRSGRADAGHATSAHSRVPATCWPSLPSRLSGRPTTSSSMRCSATSRASAHVGPGRAAVQRQWLRRCPLPSRPPRPRSDRSPTSSASRRITRRPRRHDGQPDACRLVGQVVDELRPHRDLGVAVLRERVACLGDRLAADPPRPASAGSGRRRRRPRSPGRRSSGRQRCRRRGSPLTVVADELSGRPPATSGSERSATSSTSASLTASTTRSLHRGPG